MVSAARKNNRIKQRKKDRARIIGENVKTPNCLVLTRGSVSVDLRRLSLDFQKIMEPLTQSRLQGSRKNSIKDFLAVSAQLNLSHIIIFTQTVVGIYVKLCRVPHGPTITFKIINYTRSKDVLSSLKKQYTNLEQYEISPCIMTNLQLNEGDPKLQVTARMLLDMFPTITPEKASPSKIRRCCLFHYDYETEEFDLRHYSIRVVPVEVSKGLKKMMGRKVPDLGRFSDVSEYMTKAGMLSDSEAEDDPNARVTVSHEKARGLPLKSSVRLTELGPRLTLKIYKVEGGLLGGQVLYHSIVIKTDEEKLRLEEEMKRKKKLKLKRKKEQDENVAAKKKRKEEHKKKCLAGMGITKKEAKDLAEGSKVQAEDADDEEDDADDDDDDDVDYYRNEVGEEPDPDFFSRKHKKHQKNTSHKKELKTGNIKTEQTGRKKVKVKRGGKDKEDFNDISLRVNTKQIAKKKLKRKY